MTSEVKINIFNRNGQSEKEFDKQTDTQMILWKGRKHRNSIHSMW